MIAWQQLLSPVSIMPFLALIGVIWVAFRSGGFTGATESNKILRGLNEDLKADLLNKEAKHSQEMKTMKDSYEKQIDALQTQVNTLKDQVTALEKANAIATGRTEQTQILEIIKTFVPFVNDVKEFHAVDQRLEDKLNLILKSLAVKDNRLDNQPKKVNP